VLQGTGLSDQIKTKFMMLALDLSHQSDLENAEFSKGQFMAVL
jgi:hypothetical protein